MTTDLQIDLPMEAIADFCKKWQIREFAVFGSVLRDDFGPDSDIDVMVTVDDAATWTLIDHVRMKDELESLLHRRVDLLTRRSVEQGQNPLRRRDILASARVVHSA